MPKLKMIPTNLVQASMTMMEQCGQTKINVMLIYVDIFSGIILTSGKYTQ